MVPDRSDAPGGVSAAPDPHAVQGIGAAGAAQMP